MLDGPARIGERVARRWSWLYGRGGGQAASRGARASAIRRRTSAPAEQVERELEAALRLRIGVVITGRRDRGRGQAIDERSEFELPKALGDRPSVIAAGLRRLERQLDRHVGHDAADLAAHERGLAILGEPVAELALHLVEAIEELVEGAELLEE